MDELNMITVFFGFFLGLVIGVIIGYFVLAKKTLDTIKEMFR